MSERLRQRAELDAAITKLETQVKSLRTQLQGLNGEPKRADQGDNRARIKEYLAQIPENKGARMVAIREATGIGASSVAFTLKNYSTDFVGDEKTKIWKLKTP